MIVFILFMLGCGWYSFTYGLNLWREKKNKLGGGAMISLAVFGTLIPIMIMLMKA